mmetsp:Transcript_62770/g.86778  ORF Transcript_62770/g.86778 Transcript_62770/m.86778 type:complete len:125 (-) Transcript_62770:1029-1403(-)|eukprot:CAMPEP_0176357728 /NCGR_PEP_ID=MMETSP0126-20121128/15006_1 /TAXON_ID=141414 ORGANISM="Strombidinopsis acuminatum, Strain SPMC142" /NCGR_SAMPLE_ID=MMETSP0126 /ASSEMBLY_ACC=CAM_ASM_000229 /LENGTH=124 /DNA_ID=CAMNT_0017711511 /DNA_START=212 /DNA_END=586 /DNA_ORIENTATION=-
MLRGNHETRSMTEYYTFRAEVIEKFDLEVYEAFMEMFDLLPIAASVNGQYLCVHGGISPKINTISEINEIERKEEPTDGPLNDLLWSDPIDEKINAVRHDFMKNAERGGGATKFGLDPVKQLLH